MQCLAIKVLRSRIIFIPELRNAEFFFICYAQAEEPKSGGTSCQRPCPTA